MDSVIEYLNNTPSVLISLISALSAISGGLVVGFFNKSITNKQITAQAEIADKELKVKIITEERKRWQIEFRKEISQYLTKAETCFNSLISSDYQQFHASNFEELIYAGRKVVLFVFEDNSDLKRLQNHMEKLELLIKYLLHKKLGDSFHIEEYIEDPSITDTIGWENKEYNKHCDEIIKTTQKIRNTTWEEIKSFKFD